MKCARLVSAALAACIAIPCQSAVYANNAYRYPVFASADRALQWPNRSALLFVGQGKRQNTAILDSQQKQIGSVPAPDGYFALDSAGTLYDVPYSGGELVTFSPPYHAMSFRIGFGLDFAEGVAVDALHGVVAVPIMKNEHGGPGPLYINFYSISGGSPALCATVQAPAAGLFGTGAFDREGTLFLADYQYNGINGIATVSGGCSATAVQFNGFPSGFEPDGDGFLLVNSYDHIAFQRGNNIVLTFAHPVNGMFTAPIATTVMKSQNKFVFATCFASDGAHIWASQDTAGRPHTLTEYAYPEGGLPMKTVAMQDFQSCTPAPPVIP